MLLSSHLSSSSHLPAARVHNANRPLGHRHCTIWHWAVDHRWWTRQWCTGQARRWRWSNRSIPLQLWHINFHRRVLYTWVGWRRLYTSWRRYRRLSGSRSGRECLLMAATSPGTGVTWALPRRAGRRWDRRPSGWLDGVKILSGPATSPWAHGHALFLRIKLRTRPTPQLWSVCPLFPRVFF